MAESWKNVFNGGHKRWGTIRECAKAAAEAGYPMFGWNGQVYRTPRLEEFKSGSYPAFAKVCLAAELADGISVSKGLRGFPRSGLPLGASAGLLLWLETSGLKEEGHD